MTESCHQDRWDKLVVEIELLKQECARTYGIWTETCQRLHRLERQRNAAWRELVNAKMTEVT